MKYIFVIQGEGRGHFTQALSLKNTLEKNGHEVISVLVGSSPKREFPDFFTRKINCNVVRFQSPNFMPTPKGKKSPLLVSIFYNLLLLPVYIESIFKINKAISKAKPDVVINFYELLCGLTYGVLNPKPPMISIAHQYYFMTSEFKYAGSKPREFKMLNFYSMLTTLNASKILALSFRAEENSDFENTNDIIKIVPPLLRQEVLNIETKNGSYIHGYILNSGYASELKQWSTSRPVQPLHFFWDKRNVSAETSLTPNLTMHLLDDSLFVEYMAGCKAYATTGGFESVCEAMYLQKPVLMVPTHIEQECNVLDALQSNVGVAAQEFELDLLLDFIPSYKKQTEFRYWVNAAESILIQELTNIQIIENNIFVTI
jgi:uncharacterized protein (TIGR00661 family)